jgi:glycosyltransferase involved in cell wall biosynthesis
MEVKSAVIVWARHSRRAESLAAELGGTLRCYYEQRLRGLWLTPLRYAVQGYKTWHFLEREQPALVVVQSPPVFAALVVAIWCGLRGGRGTAERAAYAIDCHSGSFYSSLWMWLQPLQRRLSRSALVTLVASEDALEIVRSWQARSIFLVDGLPSLSPASGTVGMEGETRVGVISSFDYDEPLTEIFAAARFLPQVTFYLSGDVRRVPPKMLEQKPSNAILTGFLPESHYSGLLSNVHGLIVLTTEPHALNCGAYEALAMVKPVVVSDWPEIRSCFTQGCIYVSNTAKTIAAGVKKMLDERETLTQEIIIMKKELVARRQSRFDEFVNLVEQRTQRI